MTNDGAPHGALSAPVEVTLPSGALVRGHLPTVSGMLLRGAFPTNLRTAALRLADPAAVEREGISFDDTDTRRVVLAMAADFVRYACVDGAWVPLRLSAAQLETNDGVSDDDAEALVLLVLRQRTPAQINGAGAEEDPATTAGWESFPGEPERAGPGADGGAVAPAAEHPGRDQRSGRGVRPGRGSGRPGGKRGAQGARTRSGTAP